ncbi:hypothetical protein T484DRAFT_1887406 [Baffinella frigidus]|nr:hypothetical protein T484DRAFT_1887406 [Cryptophyta sp. CCMP2293]
MTKSDASRERLGLLIAVAVMILLHQDASRERLGLLIAVAVMILLHQMGYLPLLQWLQRQAEAGPRPAPNGRFGDGAMFAHGEGDEGEDGDGDAGADPRVGGDEGDAGGGEGAGRARLRAGDEPAADGFSAFVVDVMALVTGFFTSLVPQPAAPHHHAF